MWERKRGCPRGCGVGRQHASRRGRAASDLPPVGHGLLALGVAAASALAAAQALAQSTLPPLSVETAAPKRVKAKAKKAAPKVAEPPPATKTPERGDKARSEAV